jgi:hypothetical protein
MNREIVSGDAYTEQVLYEVWAVTADGMTYLFSIPTIDIQDTIDTYTDMGYEIVYDHLN